MRCISFVTMLGILLKLAETKVSTKDKPTAMVTSCLVKAVESYGEPIRKMALHYSSPYSTIATKMMESLASPFVINSPEQIKTTGLDVRIPVEIAIVLDDEINVFEIVNGTLWNRDTRFLVVLDSRDNLEEIFQDFWMHKLINVFVFYVFKDERIFIYSFLPYSKVDCSAVDVILFDEWHQGKFQKGGISEIKNNMRIKNMNGCPINVSFVDLKPSVMFPECNCSTSTEIDGIEGKLMVEVAKKFNFSATYHNNGILWGWIYPGPPVGVVGSVYTGKSQFGFGLLVPSIERHEHLDLSNAYNGRECITFGLPIGAGKKQPTYINILVFEFSPFMWILILISTVLVFATFWLISRNKREKQANLLRNSELMSYVFAILLGIPVRQPSSLVFRNMFIFYVWTTFILGVAYQASMGSKLTVPTPDPDIDLFSQLVASNLKITGHINLKRLVVNEGDLRNLNERFETTEYDIDVAIAKIHSERNMAHARHATTFLYYVLIDPKARGNVHLLKECFYQYYPRIVTTKRGPFTNRLNQIVTRFFQAGLTDFWRSQYIYNIPPKPNGFVKLSINHMLGIFLIITAGYAISGVLFVSEVIFYHVKKVSVTFTSKNRLKKK